MTLTQKTEGERELVISQSVSSFSFGAIFDRPASDIGCDPVFDARTFTYFDPFVVQNMGITSDTSLMLWFLGKRMIN
jgi:hypothetical protein